MSFCFLDAFARLKSDPPRITQAEYFSHVCAHLRGVRHPNDSVPSTIEPLVLFEPWAASLRTVALAGNYTDLEGNLFDGQGLVYKVKEKADTSEFEQLFMTCFEGRSNKFKSDLRALRKQSEKPDPLQPAACLAAQKRRFDILQTCVEEGAVFDRFLTRACEIGASGNVQVFPLLLKGNWADIQHSDEAIALKILHYGEGSAEAEWLRQNAGKGPPQDETGATATATTAASKQSQSVGKKKSKNPSNRDPNQGFSPEEIQKWFGDVNW